MTKVAQCQGTARSLHSSPNSSLHDFTDASSCLSTKLSPQAVVLAEADGETSLLYIAVCQAHLPQPCCVCANFTLSTLLMKFSVLLLVFEAQERSCLVRMDAAMQATSMS